MSNTPPGNTTGYESSPDAELLAGYVLGDLSDRENEQLESLLSGGDARDLLFQLERTAAAAQICLHHSETLRDEAVTTLPAQLAQKIRASAPEIVQDHLPSDRPHSANISQVQPSETPLAKTPSAISPREVIAWFCAAAALLVALGLWSGGTNSPDRSASEARQAMVAQSSNLIQVEWSAGKTPFDQAVTGDVVWDPKTQTGFMRFVNMPVNDPTAEQYQLWIIDPERDEEPIDGGVFDIDRSGEVVIPIDAKLTVIDPAAFAITVEQPGGVVVSTQERLPLLAAVPSPL